MVKECSVVGQLSADSRPIVARQSADTRWDHKFQDYHVTGLTQRGRDGVAPVSE